MWLFASRNDDIEMGELILSKASDDETKAKIINYQATHYTEGFHSAMHECCEYNTPNWLRWLLSIISDDNAMFTIKNFYGNTPLMICAEKCHIKCAKMILNKLKSNRQKMNEVL